MSARVQLAKAFQRDVRERVKELTDRGPTWIRRSRSTISCSSCRTRASTGSCTSTTRELIDFALARKVVLCSPTTLFAVLAVIRHAVDNFMVERRSHDILGALGELRVQWERWEEPIDKMKRGLDSAQRAYDDLAGPRKRSPSSVSSRSLEAFRDGGMPDTRVADQVRIAALRSSEARHRRLGHR